MTRNVLVLQWCIFLFFPPVNKIPTRKQLISVNKYYLFGEVVFFICLICRAGADKRDYTRVIWQFILFCFFYCNNKIFIFIDYFSIKNDEDVLQISSKYNKFTFSRIDFVLRVLLLKSIDKT